LSLAWPTHWNADEGEVPLAVQSGALLMVMPEVGKVREPALLSI